MMKTTKLRKVGNSYGVTIPKELMEKYNLNEGVELNIIEENDGFTLTPYDPEFKKWVDSFDKTNKKYKNTLKALSK
jgi:antitoxin MazE